MPITGITPAPWGGFVSADPYDGSARPAEPISWNRYIYASDDPVSRIDPNGTCDQSEDGNFSVTVCGGDPDPVTTVPSTPSGLDTSGSSQGGAKGKNFAQAEAAWQSAIKLINKSKKFSKKCDGLMKALGITEQTWRQAINSMMLEDGLTTDQTMSGLFAGGATQAIQNEGASYGNETVPQYFSQQADLGLNVTAVAALGTDLVFLNFNDISTSDIYGNAADVMHEALHNALGLTDPNLQLRLRGFGTQVGAPSTDISTAIKSNCL